MATKKAGNVECILRYVATLSLLGETAGRDIRQRIERLRAKGAMSSPDRFARTAEQVEGLSSIRGTVPRQDSGRAACACIQHHPEAWASGFPPDPSGLPRVYAEPAVLRVEQ